MTRPRLLPCFAALALGFASSACGMFGSSSDASKTRTTEPPGAIGEGLDTITTRGTVAATTTSPPATSAPRVTTSSCKPRNDETEVRYDPGLSLVLKASTTCLARGADLRMTMTITNKSGDSVRYNPNQVEFFSIKPPKGENKSSWRDRDCAPPQPTEKKAATLAPGQSLTFTGTYPGPPGTARETCRHLGTGAYDVHAVFLLCEGEAYQDGYCDIGKAEQLFAQPLRIIAT